MMIIHPFLDFNGTVVEVWEWMINFISHITGCMITCPQWDYS